MIPVVIGVPLVAVTDEFSRKRKVPDIGEFREHFRRTGHKTYTASIGKHSLTVRKVSRVGGVLWFVGSCNRKLFRRLKRQGVNIKRVSKLTAVQKTALRARGVRVIRRRSNGAVVGILPPVVMAGENPISVGLDGAEVEGEEYYVG